MDYRPEIDGLRAVAVLAVIANHFSASILPGGFLGVDVFFVISGYVITLSLAKHPAGSAREFFLGFYARRVKRILPALIVCVSMTAIVGSMFIEPDMPEFSSSMKTGIFALFGFSNVFLYLEAVDYFGSSAHLNLFTHTWSLGVEEQFYFVFPLLFWALSLGWLGAKGRIAALSVLTTASFALFVWQSSADPDAAYYVMFPRFWELSIGCIIAVALGGATLKVPALSWLGVLALGFAFILGAEHSVYTTPAAVIGTALIIAAISPGDILYRALALKPAVGIGLISYSLYLWHWPVISISRWTIGIDAWTLGPQIALMIGLAALSYAYVETPLRRAEWSPRRLMTIGFGIGGSAASAAMIWALISGYIGPLYTGSPVQLEAKGVKTLTNDKFYYGELAWRPRDCVLNSDDDVGKTITWDACAIKIDGKVANRNFLVIGNSFSAAMYEMYSVIAEQGLGRVVATSTWGASQIAGLENTTQWSKANDYYWKTIVPELTSRLRRGDVLLMINDNTRHVARKLTPEKRADLETLRVGLLALSQQMSQRGVSVVYLSQNSLMREARCTPDMAKPQWFERGDKGRCRYYTKDYTLKRIKPLKNVLEAVSRRSPNFHILDLLPEFCPGNVCRFEANSIALYRDIFSHPSIEANLMLRQAFQTTIHAVINAPQDVAKSN